MLEEKAALHFIEHIIEEDLSNGFDPKKLGFAFPRAKRLSSRRTFKGNRVKFQFRQAIQRPGKSSF